MVAILGGLWLWAGQDWSGHLCLNGLWPCVWLLDLVFGCLMVVRLEFGGVLVMGFEF